MDQQLSTLFDRLWQQYLAVTPSAEKIHKLLGEGQPLVNDHIALRTFRHAKVGLERLAAPFLALGYRQGGEYHFMAKKLYARHYEHPHPQAPKVFISELCIDQCSTALQQQVAALLEQIREQDVANEAFVYSGRHWSVSYATYQQLLAESEYAAWLSAWGYRANHFTVLVNALAPGTTLQRVNERLKQAGFRLNSSGGEIKGSVADKLEQSSTMADQIAVAFSDREQVIPSCFYEFARRYPMTDGQLYRGFVAASADKIFESTDNRDTRS